MAVELFRDKKEMIKQIVKIALLHNKLFNYKKKGEKYGCSFSKKLCT